MKKRTPKKISKKKETLRERSAPYATQRRRRKSAVDRAIEFGVDITLLEQNLKLTPTERIEQLERYVVFLEEVRRAGERMRQRDANQQQAIT